MKYCHGCCQSKNKSLFNKCSGKKDGLQSRCRDCSKRKNNEGYKNNPNRKESIKQSRDYNRLKNSKFLKRYKKYCGCKVCGEKEPVSLDLHHLDPREKEGNPSRLISYSLEKLKKEIRKCVVLCSNCHRKVHAGILRI